MSQGKPFVSLIVALFSASLLWFCHDPESNVHRRSLPSGSAGDTGSEEVPDEGLGGVNGMLPISADSGAGVTDGGPDAGLGSDIFGSGGFGSESETVEPCDYSVPGCDFERVAGCCRAKACDRANGSDVFNTYPIESCQALLDCVEAHPGCSTSTDPLCFQNEAPGAPCLMQGYQASHLEPDGPFAWTVDLVACLCGYQ